MGAKIGGEWLVEVVRLSKTALKFQERYAVLGDAVWFAPAKVSVLTYSPGLNRALRGGSGQVIVTRGY